MWTFDQIWSRLPHGGRGDAALAGGVFALAAFAESQQAVHGEGSRLGAAGCWLFLALVCGAWPLRHRFPIGVGWFSVAGTGAYYVLSTVDGPLVVIPVVAVYVLAAGGRIRAAAAMAAAMVTGLGLGALLAGGDVNGTAVFMLAGWLVAVVALGLVRHDRVAYAEEQARLRATEERLRIARELHDVIGHNISMINVQAAAALRRLKRDPAQAEEALDAIKASSRETLRELRATLGMLRRVDEDAPTVPVPGLARLDELVASAKLAGVAVLIERTGVEYPLPALVDLAAYRIIQESVTNATKHGNATCVTVRLSHRETGLSLVIEDDGRTVPAGSGGGSGIAGMTERARALGGELAAGPRPGGGFEVRARMPLDRSER